MATRKKSGGRTEGTPNKITQELRNIIRKIIKKELSGFEKNINKLKDKDRLELIVKLLPYVISKMESINEDGTTAARIIFSLTKASLPRDENNNGTERDTTNNAIDANSN